MTSTSEIANYLRARLGQRFAGVFASDKLPPAQDKPYSLVVNYSPSGTAGTHWVGMSFPVGGNAQYFSSFGLGPDMADHIIHTKTRFREYLQTHSTTGDYDTNSIDLQSLADDTCGEWSSYFCLHGQPSKLSKPWAGILEMSDPKARDAAIRRLVPIRPDPTDGA